MAAAAPPEVQPPAPQQAVQVGETVHVRRYGNAVIVSELVTEPGHPFFGRYEVEYADGLRYHVRANAVQRFATPPARVLVAENTDHYRAAAQLYGHPQDVVLEVGSSHGVTCDMLHQRCKHVVGIDTSHELVAEARARYPHVRFEVADGFDTAGLAALCPAGLNFTKIFVDIGGTERLHTVMALLGLYFRAFRHAVIVVKSKYLKRCSGTHRFLCRAGR